LPNKKLASFTNLECIPYQNLKVEEGTIHNPPSVLIYAPSINNIILIKVLIKTSFLFLDQRAGENVVVLLDSYFWDICVFGPSPFMFALSKKRERERERERESTSTN